MITLHESNITSFPLDNGIGVLSDAIKAFVEEELNGLFEFQMEYDSEGQLVNKLKEERIIKAKAQDKLGYQLFRIYSITKNHENDNLIIDAQHITYDLGNNFVEKLEARNITKRQVMQLIGSSTNYEHPFNVTSSNTTTQSSTSLYRTNPLQMIAGIEGSILQTWGGQIERDNFNLIMHDRRGSDDGVLVTYKKNLTGLEAKFDIENLVTRIFPFVFKEATDDEPERLITVSGKYVDSPNINDHEMPYILPIDYSSDDRINTDGTDAQIRTQLTNLANAYFNETGNDKPTVEMEVQFEHLWETEEYKDVAALELVGMGDTITVEHSKLGVEGTAVVNRIEYDVIARKNRSVDVGNVRASFTDRVNEVSNIVDRVDEIDRNANQAIRSANGKNTIYYGPDEPTDGNKDDIWFRVVDGEYTRTYRFDGIQWQLVMSKDIADIEETASSARNRASEAVEKAELATSNANEAISEAQTAFDKAQESLTTAQGLTSRISSVEGDISTLNQTTQSFATQIENVEGDISTVIQLANGLQNRVSDAEGNISTVTQLADTLQSDLRDAEGNINTLTETASSMQRTISSVRDDLDGIEIGGRNLITLDSVTRSYATVDGHKYTLTRSGSGNPYVRIPHTLFKNSTEYVMTFKVKKISGTVFSMAGHAGQIPITSTTKIYRDGELVLEGSWNTGDQNYPDDTEEHRYEIRFKTTSNVAQDNTPYLYIQPNRFAYGEDYQVEIWDFQLEKGNKATDWSPAPEDMATTGQLHDVREFTTSSFSQLSYNINLRVEKGDVINQINISDEDILISGKKLILDSDTTVTGTFRVNNANITSVDAGKMTTGTLDAAQVSVINLSANSIVGGILQSQNSTTTFNLNTGNLTMRNANFTLGGGADINFSDSGNRLYYQLGSRSSGFGVGTSLNDRYPVAFLGVANGSRPHMIDENRFSGFISNARGRWDVDGILNSVVGLRFDVRDEAVGFVKGITFDLSGSRPTIKPINAGTNNYDLGTGNNYFQRAYINEVRVNEGEIMYRNTHALNQGFSMMTSYQGESQMAFYGLNAHNEYYNLGKSNRRFSYVYLRYQPNVSSDERLKHDIKDNVLGLDFINDIDTKTFVMNDDLENRPQLGLIAQQVLTVLDKHNARDLSLVSKGEDDYYGMQTTQLIFPLINSAQELDKKIDLTREKLILKIASLEERLNKLEVA